MKLLMKRKWQLFASLLIGIVICATYLLAQTQITQDNTTTQTTNVITLKAAAPNAQETADSAQLIQAVNVGNTQAALQILQNYGIADTMLLTMGANLGRVSDPVVLQQPFLRASVGALALTDRLLKTNVDTFLNTNAVPGYVRPVWMPRRPNTWAVASYDKNLLQCPLAPIMVLNVRLNDPCFIRYFQLYDRFAESLHSVVLNGPNLSNAKFDPTNYAQANLTLKALYQLIKARDPNAFVWLSVVNETDGSDTQWLKAMTFRPDGLYISNLRQFNSPFAATRARYMAIVGTNMPMMVADFYGEKAALQQQELVLASAFANQDPNVRQVAEATARQQIGGIGVDIGQNLAEVQTNLQMLGYRGISVQWSLLAALANSQDSAPTDQSDLIDPRAGLLDVYYDEQDYTDMLSHAADMISNSAPGDMNWTVGNLYEGIAWLKETPPNVNDAITALDGIINFDFGSKPGRDHYILGAVEWRIYAAFLTQDTEKPRQLMQWVQGQNFRADLKSAFLKKHAGALN